MYCQLGSKIGANLSHTRMSLSIEKHRQYKFTHEINKALKVKYLKQIKCCQKEKIKKTEFNKKKYNSYTFCCSIKSQFFNNQNAVYYVQY